MNIAEKSCTKKRHRLLIKKFIRSTCATKKVIFEKAPNCFIKRVSQCCKAALNNEFELSEEVQDIWKSNEPYLEFMSNEKVPLKKKEFF
jgi:hypothetical protein